MQSPNHESKGPCSPLDTQTKSSSAFKLKIECQERKMQIILSFHNYLNYSLQIRTKSIYVCTSEVVVRYAYNQVKDSELISSKLPTKKKLVASNLMRQCYELQYIHGKD